MTTSNKKSRRPRTKDQSKKTRPKSKVSTRSPKNIKRSKSKRVSSRRQTKGTKIKNYEDAYNACIEKAMASCAKRNKIVEKMAEKVDKKIEKKVSKKNKGKSKATSETNLTPYQLFVKKHMKNKKLQDFSIPERLKEIAKMWREYKEKYES